MAGPAMEILSHVDRVFVSFGEIPQGTASKPKMTAATAGKHIIFVDQYKDFPTSELTDGVHPTVAGHGTRSHEPPL